MILALDLFSLTKDESEGTRKKLLTDNSEIVANMNWTFATLQVFNHLSYDWGDILWLVLNGLFMCLLINDLTFYL